MVVHGKGWWPTVDRVIRGHGGLWTVTAQGHLRTIKHCHKSTQVSTTLLSCETIPQSHLQTKSMDGQSTGWSMGDWSIYKVLYGQDGIRTGWSKEGWSIYNIVWTEGYTYNMVVCGMLV